MEAFSLFARMIERCKFHPEILGYLITEIEESNLLDLSEKIVLLSQINNHLSSYEKAIKDQEGQL